MKRVVGGTKWWQVHDIQGCAPLVLCLSCYLTPGLGGGTDWLPSRSVPKRTGRTRRDAPKSAGGSTAHDRPATAYAILYPKLRHPALCS